MFHVKHRAQQNFPASGLGRPAIEARHDRASKVVRRHRNRRRPRRLRGRDGIRAHGREDGAGDPSLRDRRRDVLQSRHRRTRQGSSGSRGRCAGRIDGPGRGRCRHPVSDAQPPQGAGGARAARAGRPQALRRGDAGRDPRDRKSRGDRRRGRRADRGRAAASPASAWPMAANSPPAPWSSPPARFCAA